MIDSLELDERQKRFLRSRWLDQLLWVEQKATKARDRYYRLRLTTMVGAVLLPALITVHATQDKLDSALRGATWLVSLIVAVSAAVEQLFHFGERWRNYRRTAERLKSEGWLLFQLSGPYSAGSHAAAYPAFAERVEDLLKGDVELYLSRVAVEKDARNEQAGT